jgi:hypothetical protein
MKTELTTATVPSNKAALDAFMQRLWDSTLENPIGNGRIFGWALIDAHPFDGHIWLKELRALEHRLGHGTKALQFFCSLADTYRVPIILTPKRIGTKGMNNAQLRRWYRAFGFEPRRDGDMRRGLPAELKKGLPL